MPPLRFPEFSGEWERCQLQDICGDLEYGMNAAAKEFDGENKYIRITDIDEETSLYNNSDIVSPDSILESKYIVKDNDILFARTGASTGKTYLYDSKDGKLYYAGFLIRANVKTGNARFVFYQTKTARYKKWVKIMSARSGQPGINSQEYGSYPIYVASNEEQDKLSTFLALVDERINTQKKIIEELKKLKSAIQETNYTDDNQIKLGLLIRQSSERNKNGKYTNVLSVSNKLGFVDQTEQFEDRVIASDDRTNYKVVSYNTFAYNPARINVGSIARYAEALPGIVSPMYICFTTVDLVEPTYLEYFFQTKSFKDEMEKRLEGSVRQCLTFDGLTDISIPLPNINEQKDIARRLDTFSSRICLERGFLTSLLKQKQYLLSHMFI